jgi:hypothetical protein
MLRLRRGVISLTSVLMWDSLLIGAHPDVQGWIFLLIVNLLTAMFVYACLSIIDDRSENYRKEL